MCQLRSARAPSLMVPRAVLRAIQPGQPFSIEVQCWKPFLLTLCDSMTLFQCFWPHSQKTIVKGFHHSTEFWPTQLGTASAESLYLNQGRCIRSLTKRLASSPHCAIMGGISPWSVFICKQLQALK